MKQRMRCGVTGAKVVKPMCEQRIEPVVRIAALIETERAAVAAALHQFGRGIMIVKVYDHLGLNGS
jgi:hypothetical protein